MKRHRFKSVCYILSALLVLENSSLVFAKQKNNATGIIYIGDGAQSSPLAQQLELTISKKGKLISQDKIAQALDELSNTNITPSLNDILKQSMDEYYNGETRTKTQALLKERFRKIQMNPQACLSESTNTVANWTDVAIKMVRIYAGERQFGAAMAPMKLAYKLNPHIHLSDKEYPESITKLFNTVRSKPVFTNTQPEKMVLTVNSLPANATAYLDGVAVGQTPLTINVKSKNPVILSVASEGHEPKCHVLGTSSIANQNLALSLNKKINRVAKINPINWATLSQNNFLVSALANKVGAEQLIFVYANRLSKLAESQITSYQIYKHDSFFMGTKYTTPKTQESLALTQEIMTEAFPKISPIKLAKHVADEDNENSNVPAEKQKAEKPAKEPKSGGAKTAIWIVGGIVLAGAAAGIGIGMGGGGSGGSNQQSATISVNSPQPQ